MCMFSQPSIPSPEPVPDRAASRLPDGDTARTAAGRRTQDRVRAGTNTVLTSGIDLTTGSSTGKTLLGA